MTQYIIVYLGGDQPSGPEESKQHFSRYMAWLSSLGDSVVSPANPLRIARTITVSLVSWPGFFERVQDSGGTATLVPCLHTSLKLTYSSSGSEICQDQGSDLFVPSPQTQGKTAGWNKRSGSTKRSREEQMSQLHPGTFQIMLDSSVSPIR